MIPTAIKICIPHVCSTHIDVDAAKKMVENLNKQIADSWEERALNRINDNSFNLVEFRKIPIVIMHYDDGVYSGWRAELPDNYKEFKPTCYDKINFEDLGFHFVYPTEHIPIVHLFKNRKDAKEAAMHVNEMYLEGKAKLWYLDKKLTEIKF